MIRDRETLRRLSTLGEYAQHVARASVAVGLAMEVAPDVYDASFDAGRVSHALMLAAHTLGVGSCIAFLDFDVGEEVARELLRIPRSHRMWALISFGYPAAIDAHEMVGGPSRRAVLSMLGRKPLDELVIFERFSSSSRDSK